MVVFDNISSRDFNILYFCKKIINRLVEPVNIFLQKWEIFKSREETLTNTFSISNVELEMEHRVLN